VPAKVKPFIYGLCCSYNVGVKKRSSLAGSVMVKQTASMGKNTNLQK
jgi:hypothetical protein